jgi:hypothetical protein
MENKNNKESSSLLLILPTTKDYEVDFKNMRVERIPKAMPSERLYPMRFQRFYSPIELMKRTYRYLSLKIRKIL